MEEEEEAVRRQQGAVQCAFPLLLSFLIIHVRLFQ